MATRIRRAQPPPSGRAPVLKILPWVTMDEGYDGAGHLLDTIHQANKLFFTEIQRVKHVWLKRPRVVVPTARSGQGRPRTRARLALTAAASQTVEAVALKFRPNDWQRFIIHEGSQGPLEVELAFRRVVMAAEELPGRDAWLVLQRPVGASVEKWKVHRPMHQRIRLSRPWRG